MADKKITALTATASVALTDILPVVTDPGGAAETKKITVDQFKNSISASTPNTNVIVRTGGTPTIDEWLRSDGWISANDHFSSAWSYASATTFVITGDYTALFPVDTKLKLTNGTVKYFYVVSASYGAPNTTVTVNGGNGAYALAAGAISNRFYSYENTPQGFPVSIAVNLITGPQVISQTTAWQGLIGNPTWTYASASTFTIAGDVSGFFPVGAKIRLTQPTLGTKFFYVVSASYGAPNTTVTVTGGTSYTLANEAITSPYISYASTPHGFPHWFNYTPTWTNFTVGDGTLNVGRFSVTDRLMRVEIFFTLGSTSAVSAALIASIPITTTTSAGVGVGDGGFNDATGSFYPGHIRIQDSTKLRFMALTASGTYLVATDTTNLIPFTWTTADSIRISATVAI